MTSKLRAGLLAASSALALGMASANAQSWNMYQPYTSSAFVPFVSAMGPAVSQGAEVNLTVGNMSTPKAITMDTGSIGLQVSPDVWNPVGLTPIGPGSITLNSSGVTNSGNFYDAPVNFFTNGGKNVATATVPVLVVTQTCTNGVCKPTGLSNSVFYMGVGVDRTAGENLVTPNAQLVNGQTLNTFLNVTQINGQAIDPASIRQGYIINSANGATGGVTLGLTQKNTQGFSFVKLGANPSTSLDTWNAAPMSYTVTNGGQSASASSGAVPPPGGGVLPDAGINYMFMSPVPGNVTTVPCTVSGLTRNCVQPGAQVQVSLPGTGAASGLAQYSFTVGPLGTTSPTNVVQPANVVVLSGQPFVNTGREFFLGFQYVYDSAGGYVGYGTLPALGSSGSVNPGVALVGSIGLPNGFANSLPVFLIGDTTLQQAGTGTFSSSIVGSGSNFAVAGGSVLFGAPVDLGGGSFFVQPGAAATVSSSFAASALNVSTGGQFLVGAGGSLLGAPSVTNFGLFDISGASQAVGIQALKGSGQVNLGGQNLTIINANGTFSGTIADGGASGGVGGSLTLAGGTLGLGGANTYTGGTTVASGATLNLTGSIMGSLFLSGAMTSTGGYSVAPGAVFNNSGSFQSLAGATLVNQGSLTNSGLLTSNVLNSGFLLNTGTIVGNVGNSGTLTNNGLIQGTTANTGIFNGTGLVVGNFANSGVLNSNGTFAGNVLNTGTLAGNPIIVGNLANSGILSPGNSIGTITVAGNAALASSTTYSVEVNAQGQNDALSVGGSTAIQGGTVAVTPLNGVYAPRTTYSIVSSAGGVSGSFSSVSSSNPFLLPSLSYGANNVFLTITIGGFLAAAQNPVQAAVGGALDGSVLQASGDYAQVLGNLASSNPSQVPAILTSLSGMNYSGFANSMVQTAQLFMSNFS
ncbi:MAG: hypothetical protein JOY64_08050, partial [Alphaproteobacteria bacterium]|nr:hypothetical protein [Alphaproteobacteria bacterium]